VQGSLFTRDFLLQGIAETDEWQALKPAEVEAFRKAIADIFATFPITGEPKEPQTEDDLIVPVLKALGWTQYLRQQPSAKRRENIPDILLFADADAKKAANAETKSPKRYRHGKAIVESKAWQLPLDRGAPDLFNQDAPSSQILRYLTQVENASDRAIQWGILTNGRLWRLYFQGASSRSEEFLELDLAVLGNVAGVQPQLGAEEATSRDHLFKAFLLLFSRASFLPGAEDGRTFHQIALSRTKEWEARVSENLSEIVFGQVFRHLVNAIVEGDAKTPKKLNDAYLDEARHAALTLLYRLLFVLYAEDRNLLPAHDRGYSGYSLRVLRNEVQNQIDHKSAFSKTATKIWDNLKTIFALVDKGDADIGLPPYNGGLFDSEKHALLARTKLSDSAIGPALDLLSRERGRDDAPLKRINYRDLSVQHLGSIYERLLEYAVVGRDGRIEIELNPFARKGSGSYYTHEDLVRLIIERTVGPLVTERLAAFEKKSAELAKTKTSLGSRIKELSSFDPAVALLGLKVCDPAMGSGHFLVSLVDYLADEILEAMGLPVEWTDTQHPYKSPLIERIGAIRQRIRDEAAINRWKVDESHLDDRHLVRRMILKRCIYGVDKNPVAVELAQVSLWLHTFTVGAPLSFLDHHLRCGDSLFGEWVRPVEDMLKERSTLFLNPSVARAKASAKGMLDVEALTDADIVEVHRSASKFKEVEEATAPLTRFMDVVHALKWVEPASDEKTGKAKKDAIKAAKGAVQAYYQGDFGDPVAIAAGAQAPKGKGAEPLIPPLAEAHALVAEQRFLHWEVAFPGVWTDWESAAPTGGFDAVIGNPPWDRMKLQEVEWFASRRAEIALQVRASDRKKKIAALEKANDPLWQNYTRARERAERAAEIARDSGQYPLLSGGDLNIYSLFVERAQRLIKPNGIAGLLTPSGIASDLTASVFFKSIATSGRLAALFDFENRWPTYFPDVDSRFKFSVFVVGGKTRKFNATSCAFFLNGADKVASNSFTLSAEDFARVNPNTGTAPVFRSKRDAEITRSIYERLPILVRHAPGSDESVWPVRYFTMFHMTNDAGLFRTHAELEKAGWYSVADEDRLRKGNDEAVPLYVGKMVHQFDHRSASVDVNEDNLHVAASSGLTTLDQHRDPSFFPTPQFWVETSSVEKVWPNGIGWLIGFRDIARTTDVRTVIASIVPYSGVGNKLPLLVPYPSSDEIALQAYRRGAPLLLANFNAFVFDYVARQKIQSTNLNWYIVEQLPVVPWREFDKKVGKTKIADFICDEVLRLTYTASDMKPFARDMGFDGAPFKWDEDDRRHRRARLDALFFRLYGIDEEDAAYILDTFSIVREQDEAAFGRYLTKELVLGYMRAVAAGDLKSRVVA